jgi:hypothetical protein
VQSADGVTGDLPVLKGVLIELIMGKHPWWPRVFVAKVTREFISYGIHGVTTRSQAVTKWPCGCHLEEGVEAVRELLMYHCSPGYE